jgi:hypothetical protein
MTFPKFKQTVFLLLVVVLLLAACGGGGGGGGGCEHLSCAPETNVMEKVSDLLEDAEDGIIDEGESDLGDAIIDVARALSDDSE